MTTSITPANKEILQAQIATLDFQIARLTKLFTAISFKTGSLMLAGRSVIGKDFNELITWRDDVPLPKQHLKDFLQHYCQYLIYQRHNCAMLLEDLVLKNLYNDSGFISKNRISNCDHCSRQTLQRNYFIISGTAGIAIPAPPHTWICNECDSIIKEGHS